MALFFQIEQQIILSCQIVMMKVMMCNDDYGVLLCGGLGKPIGYFLKIIFYIGYFLTLPWHVPAKIVW